MDRSTAQVGKNIRAIRRRKHLTQVELAQRLGMRPGPVSNIEKGRNLPSARVLCKLAQVLDVPIDAFFEAPCDEHRFSIPGSHPDGAVREDRATYVTRADSLLKKPHAVLVRAPSERQSIPTEVLLLLSEVVDITLALEDIVGARKMADLPLSLPFDATEDGVLSLCSQVRRLLGVNEAVIFDYLELFENAGLRIVFHELPEGVESLSCHDVPNANAFLFIASGLNTERQIFRVIYELGRLYCFTQERTTGCGCGTVVSKDYRGKPFTPDRFARRFASLFLMPESAVRATVRQLGVGKGDWTYELLLRLKHRFGISAEAFLYRLDELGLIQGKRVEDFRVRIHQYYKDTDRQEPNSTRRILTPNGRLGDLLAIAAERGDEEIHDLRARLAALKCEGIST